MSFCGAHGMQPHCTQCHHHHHYHQPQQFPVRGSNAQQSSSAVHPDAAFTPLAVESSEDVRVSSDSQLPWQPAHQYVLSYTSTLMMMMITIIIIINESYTGYRI